MTKRDFKYWVLEPLTLIFVIIVYVGFFLWLFDLILFFHKYNLTTLENINENEKLESLPIMNYLIKLI